MYCAIVHDCTQIMRSMQGAPNSGRAAEHVHAVWQEMQRALFIYAKLNPGVRYVQGMNELLSPLYYSFRGDAGQAQHAEADAFFCFVELVSECRDNFTQQLVRRALWHLTSCCKHCSRLI